MGWAAREKRRKGKTLDRLPEATRQRLVKLLQAANQAVGEYQNHLATIRELVGITEQDNINLDTGQITRVPPPPTALPTPEPTPEPVTESTEAA